MSKIDQRVVEMKFDNATFRRGVQQTLSDLAELSKGLAMRGASAGLDGVDSAIKRFSLRGMLDGLQQAMGGFSALGVIAATTLASITHKALAAGAQVVKSLTLDPVMQGFQEYELKMGSVQTIMANTARHGTSLDTVNSELGKLNEYSDKTIYNFAEMTKNASLFTASGMKIEDATTVIKGFSNEAAASGTSAEGAAGAAYQLSQALNAGTIRLMDWRSLQNVGMGNKNMQEGIIGLAKAMGTLKAGSDTAALANKDFNGSLEKGWLSADVMSTYLKAMSGDMTEAELAAKGLSAAQIATIQAQAQMGLDAATKVRTLSGLMNTLKEGVASGWATSMEIVFGNFTEATELFTGVKDAIGGLLDNTSNARNQILKDWKALGGREHLIQGIKNAFNALFQVLRPIRDAFREVFPAKTGADLALLTKRFRQFTVDMLLGENTMNNLKRTFQGIFSVIKIVTTVIGGITKAIFGLFDAAGSSAGGFLAITAVIGDFLTAISQILTKTGAIQAFFSVLVSPLLILKPLIGLVSNLAVALGSLLSGDVDAFTSKIADAFSIFGDGLNAVSDRFDSFTNKLSGGLEAISGFLMNFSRKAAFTGNTVVAGITRSLSKAIGFLSSFFADARGTISDLIQVLNGASVSSGNFLAGFSGGILEGIMNLIDRVRDRFVAFRESLDFSGAFSAFNLGASSAASTGGTILSTLGSMLTGLWGGLSSMFSGVGKALGPVTSSLSNFFSTLVSKITEYIKNMDMQDAVALLNTGMFIAMYLAIRSFFKKMSEIADMFGGMIDSITGTFDQLTSTLKTMQNNVRANIILKIAIAVGILAAAVLVLSTINGNDLKKALVALSVLFVQLGIALAIITKMDPKSMTSSAGGLILLAIAIRIMAGAIKTLGEMDFEVLRQGLISLGLILGAIMILVKVMDGAKGIFVAAAGLLILSAALAALAAVIVIYQRFDYATIIDGVGAMAITLGLIGIAMGKMPKGMIAKAAGLVILSFALTMLAGVLKIFATMSVGEMAKSLIMLAASLAIMVAAMTLATGGLAGAAALLIMAAALMLLVPVLKLFASLSWEGIAKGVAGLALVLGVLVVAMYALTPVIAVLAIFAAALKIVGIAILLAGTGVMLLAAGIGLLAITGAAGFAVLMVGLQGFLNMLPLIAQQVGHAFIAFAAVIAAAAPKLMDAFGVIIMAFISKVGEIAVHLYAAGIDMIMGFLRAIRDRIGGIVTIVGEIITNFIDALAVQLPRIIESAVNLIVAFMEGLATALNENAERIGIAAANIGMAIIDGIVAGLRAIWDRLPQALQDLARDGLDAIRSFLGIRSPSTVFIGVGKDIVMGMINGIGDMVGGLITKAKTVVSEAISGAKAMASKAADIGSAIVDGIAKGIRDAANRVKDAALALAQKLPGWVKKVLGIESPSKVFAEIGKYIDEGLSLGIASNSGTVMKSTENLGNDTINIMRKTLNKLSDTLILDVDTQPTIRPILDLTDVQRNANRLNSMLSSQSISVGSIYSRAQDASEGYRNNQVLTTDTTPVLVEENHYSFSQTNTSPKALSTADLYRQSRNLMSVTKNGALTNVK